MANYPKMENDGSLTTSFSESVSFNHNYNCCYTLDKEQIDKKLEAEIADQKERTAHNGFVKKVGVLGTVCVALVAVVGAIWGRK